MFIDVDWNKQLKQSTVEEASGSCQCVLDCLGDIDNLSDFKVIYKTKRI